jgi:hypothetical protein
MTFAGLKTLIGACQAPVNSSRGFSTAVLTASVAYEAIYTGAGSHTVTMTGDASVTWDRVPFPRGAEALETPPGDGQFYVAQQCCCPGRAAFILGDDFWNSEPARAGGILVPIVLTSSDQLTDEDGDPLTDEDGDPIPPEVTTINRQLSLQLWDKLAAPCRKADGPSNSPRAILYVPEDPLVVTGDELEPDSIETTVGGNYEPIEDAAGASPPVVGYLPFVFTAPEPCSDFQDFEMEITRTWTLDAATATSSISYSLAIS